MKKLFLIIPVLAILLSGCSVDCRYELSSVSQDENEEKINTFFVGDKNNSFMCSEDKYIKYDIKEVIKMYNAINN